MKSLSRGQLSLISTKMLEMMAQMSLHEEQKTSKQQFNHTVQGRDTLILKLKKMELTCTKAT